MSYQPDHKATHMCLVCGKSNARITRSGWGTGVIVETECPDCKSTGVIGNQEPWCGHELPIEKLRAMFALAEIEIIGDPVKLQNAYWQGHDKKYYHPWWFVQTKYGWIEIGWRKNVMSIDWRHTTLRHIVTDENLTKGEDHVHAYTEAKAIEYLTALSQFAEKKESFPAGEDRSKCEYCGTIGDADAIARRECCPKKE